MKHCPNPRSWWKLASIAAVSFLLSPSSSTAQEGWKKPPPDVVKILEAEPLPQTSLSPDRSTLILASRESLPRLSELAKPTVRLAGSRIDPKTFGPHGPRAFVGLKLKRMSDGRELAVEHPEDVGIGMPSWAPSAKRFAFAVTHPDRIELWVGDAENGRAKAIPGVRLNGTMGMPFHWLSDSKRCVAHLVPADRGAAPERPAVPGGPNVHETSGRTAPVRTYQDLLSDAHDEALFEHFMTAQLAVIDMETGEVRTIGKPAIFDDAAPSPSGELLLVTRIVRPYSRVVPSSSFPSVVEVWNLNGELVKEIARLPVRDNVPIEGVPTGPRGIQWAAARPALLTWAEALDDGDPKKKVSHRDRIMAHEAPFAAEPREVGRTEHRFRGMSWLSDGDRVLVSEYDRDRRWSRTWLRRFAPDEGEEPTLLWDRSVKDRYGDPGDPLMKRNSAGRMVVHVHEDALFLRGAGATPAGDRPFLDRLSLVTLRADRVWRCDGPRLESVVDILDDDGSRVLTRHETPVEPPNYFVVSLPGGERSQVTRFEHPAPELRGITKELVTYDRADGVKLSGTLYLPANYQRDQRLPLVVWAYPEEFNDPATAGQVSGSPYAFTMIGGTSHLFFLTQGYAVMDGASMPVVGDPEKANDTFVEQIVTSAKAAIDKAASMGVADPKRAGVGGHSYGAFMTANLLAHCDLFRAGIARSGAYNRSLTPFGFQNERRTFWEARDIYVRMSPFSFAHQVNEPILLIHGAIDSNPGTFPMQSERLFHAIKGHGGTARHVVLPYEGHGYRAKESVLHVLAEMFEWFDRHVKGQT